MKPLREVLAPQLVVAAYEQTGLEPVWEYWLRLPTAGVGLACACPAVVTALAAGKLERAEVAWAGDMGHDIVELVAHALAVDPDDLRAFIGGFDDDEEEDAERVVAQATWELGREVRRAVVAWRTSRGKRVPS